MVTRADSFRSSIVATMAKGSKKKPLALLGALGTMAAITTAAGRSPAT
jgi:hypothetical protein